MPPASLFRVSRQGHWNEWGPCEKGCSHGSSLLFIPGGGHKTLIEIILTLPSLHMSGVSLC